MKTPPKSWIFPHTNFSWISPKVWKIYVYMRKYWLKYDRERKYERIFFNKQRKSQKRRKKKMLKMQIMRRRYNCIKNYSTPSHFGHSGKMSNILVYNYRLSILNHSSGEQIIYYNWTSEQNNKNNNSLSIQNCKVLSHKSSPKY